MIKFLKGLQRVGLLGFRRTAHSFVGAFTVAKKDSQWQRLVLDARATNLCRRRAPYAPLASAGATALIDLSHLPTGAAPCGVGADLQDWFYQFKWPHMASWFAFNCRVSAEEFNISEIFDEASGQYVPVDSPAERLWPAFEGLVMGWSWALYLCHSSLTAAMIEATTAFMGTADRDEVVTHLMRDRCPGPVLRKGVVLLAPYVDNANAILFDFEDGQRFYDLMLNSLRRRGFILKELVPPTDTLDMVGVIFHGKSRQFRHRPVRFWKLYFGIHDLLSHKGATGETVRALAGHLVNFFMLDRAAFSVLTEVYRFSYKNLGSWALLPAGLRAELRVAAGIMLLATHDADRPGLNHYFCSDASTKGYAVHVRHR